MDVEAMHAAGLEAARALPTETPVAEATPTETTPQGEQTETATAEADSFTKLDLSTLPAELRPYYDSMQSDYTRKTQEIAPYRQLAQETGLDVDGLRQSAELYNALQDPTQLVAFHTELTTALQAQGLTRAEATAAATQHITEVQSGGGEEPAFVDPEEKRYQDLESRLTRFEQQEQQATEARKNEMMQMALVAEMNRQQAVVQESHPDWLQSDIDAVYELSAYYGGNLIDASNRYDEVVSDRVTRILNGKGAAAGNAALTPLPPATSGVSRGLAFGDDLEAAHKAAMAAARQLP